MLKALALITLVLAVRTAHAEYHAPEKTVADVCSHDTSCIARALATALTGERGELRLRKLVIFEPGRQRVYSKDREKIEALARSWKQHDDWAMIKIGYAADDLNRERADRIREYFMRYGVPAAYVVTGGDGAIAGADRSVDVTIETCTHATSCARRR